MQLISVRQTRFSSSAAACLRNVSTSVQGRKRKLPVKALRRVRWEEEEALQNLLADMYMDKM